MTEPRLRKFPAELFGYAYSNLGETAQKARKEQYCPFLRDECKKPRKSEPHIKVGICSVGYKGNHSDKHLPVIICPHRFEFGGVQKTIQEKYFPSISPENIVWFPEAHVTKTVGFFDYVVAHVEKCGATLQVRDFICVEVQAAGTTGTPWDAVLEHQRTGQFSKDTYDYGINWANEFAKTMMQQAYKKGLMVRQWKKKLVFVLQDIGLRYLEQNYDTSGLREPKPSDPVEFYALEMAWVDKKSAWELRFARRVSTDTDGIRKMLGGVSQDLFPTSEEFIQRLLEKAGY
jgi:hypothetical protein